MILYLILSLLLSSQRVISDRRPLPSDIKQTEKKALDRMNSADTFEVAFDEGEYSISEPNDTIYKPRFSGFDKALNSSKESFFITNINKAHLTQITFDITYFTTDRVMLHKREIILNCEIPSDETRRYDISAWDSQHQFYYLKTGPSPKRQGTPFVVGISPKKARFHRDR